MLRFLHFFLTLFLIKKFNNNESTKGGSHTEENWEGSFFLLVVLMAFLPSSSSFTYAFITYDVFLNFRGIDTRYGFTGNLYKALHDKGIRTFIDDEELQRGDEITPALVKAIEESRIAIPIFSKNYASSSFSLDELVNIIDCVKEKGRLVLPIFYDVDPSHVRHQIGSYGEALAKHEKRFATNNGKLKDNMERLQKWKMALNQAANLSGHHFKLGNEYEHEFIGRIVKEVSNKINFAPLHVADYPVGLESRMLQVKTLLEVGYNDRVHMVGIYGVGGVGKTTLARAIYNLIADQFDGVCFLDDVRENSIKHGLEHLQEKLLYEIVGEKDIKIASINKGISIVEHRLCRKKILLILDDVDKLEQLRAIVGKPNWFGSGSRIIITTRDKHLLVSHEVERRYVVEELNEKEALELLGWNAFKHDRINPIYLDVLNRAVAYASGLPLALEVIGSNLYAKSIGEWESALDQYERIPNKRILKILQVSFDSLEEEEKTIFLDIACCIKGYDLTKLEEILHAHHGNCMKHHIGVLVEKSLVKISKYGEVKLHGLIEDMGKEIVRQESPKEPGKRSRLWFPKDIIRVLEDSKGTGEIEIIHLDSSIDQEVVIEWDGEAFKKMENLKTLIIRCGCFSEGPKHLPNGLRVLEWCRYPLQHLPSDFHPKKLAICKLPDGHFSSLGWVGFGKKFMSMGVLRLDFCQYLTHIPDISPLPNLKELSFSYCENLISIHHSVGFLDKLKILCAEGCSKLKIFPALKLPSLEVLQLSFCDSLEDFPEILGEMQYITDLYLIETPIKEIPSSIQNLTQLEFFHRSEGHIEATPPTWRWIECDLELPLKSEDLYFLACDLSDGILARCLTLFANVGQLNISKSNLTILPECIKECHFLWKLILDDCECLQEIREIPQSLIYLSAVNCESLTCSSKRMLQNQELYKNGDIIHIILPGGKVPEWFDHNNGPISLWFRNSLPAVAVCFVFPPALIERISVLINGMPILCEYNYDLTCLPRQPMKLDHSYLLVMRLQKPKFKESLLKNQWNHMEVELELGSLFLKSGIHVSKISIEDTYFATKVRLTSSQIVGSKPVWLMKQQLWLSCDSRDPETWMMM